MSFTSPMKGVPLILQNAAVSVGNGLAIAPSVGITRHTFYLKTGSIFFVSAAVSIESADAIDFAGDWAPIAGAPFVITVINSQQIIVIEGVFIALRARITAFTTDPNANLTVTYYGG